MPNRSTAERARRAARWRARHSWFDVVAVERALRDWALGDPLTSPGRRLSRRERRVVVHALLAVGETITGITRFLRVSNAVATELAAPPVPGAPAIRHREQVADAVAFLERYGARERIALRYHPLSTGEANRIVGLAIGRGEQPEKIFNPRFVAPR